MERAQPVARGQSGAGLGWTRKADGPTAGTVVLDPLEFLAGLLTHIADPGQVMTRYDGWYASRTGGRRRRPEPRRDHGSGGLVPAGRALPLGGAAPAHFEVDPLTCPRCAAPMRIVAVLTDPAVLTRILAHRARVLERARQSRGPRPGRRQAATRATGGDGGRGVRPAPPEDAAALVRGVSVAVRRGDDARPRPSSSDRSTGRGMGALRATGASPGQVQMPGERRTS
jgi:hypothetical protein